MNNTNDSEVSKNFEIGDELQDANGKNNADAIKSYFGKIIFGVRKSFAAKCEQSVLSQLIESLYYLILSLPMKVFGIYLTSFGLSALIFKYVTDYNGFAFFTDVDTVTIICFLITGIVMLPAGKSFGELLSGSKFFS